MMIQYSFIIPHHNTPNLLNRCLKSIPVREDVEIIVIDDNSDVNKRPFVNRSDVNVLTLVAEESHGAGHARNIGLQKANGKWIVFSDADDYFVSGFLETLDNYVNTNVDAVYFPAISVDNDTMEDLPQILSKQNMCFAKHKGEKYTTDLIKYRLHSPWWKIVRREFIKEHRIKFEAVPKGNDIFFSYQVGYFAKKVAVEKRALYVHTYNRNGISYGKKNLNIRVCSLIQRYKMNKFYLFVGYAQWRKSILGYFYEVLKYDGLILFVQTLIYFVFHFRSLKKSEDDYVNSLRRNEMTN